MAHRFNSATLDVLMKTDCGSRLWQCWTWFVGQIETELLELMLNREWEQNLEQRRNLGTRSGMGWKWERGLEMGTGSVNWIWTGRLDLEREQVDLEVGSRIQERKFWHNDWEVCVSAKLFRCRCQKKSGSCLAAATLRYGTVEAGSRVDNE